MIFLIIRTVAVEIIDRLYVVYRPMGILLPVVFSYGGVELLRVGETFHSRTKKAYASMNGLHKDSICFYEYYLKISHLDRLAAKAHLSEGDRIAYDKAVDRYNVSRIVENDIREQAVAEGKAIGKAIGKAEGKAEGEAEGRLKERLEIARKLKENGFSIADIVRVAGLSAEEIDKL